MANMFTKKPSVVKHHELAEVSLAQAFRCLASHLYECIASHLNEFARVHVCARACVYARECRWAVSSKLSGDNK